MRHNVLAALMAIGMATIAGLLAIRAYFPLNRHVGAFLAIYAALCLLSLATAIWLRRFETTLDARSPRFRVLLPWLVMGFGAAFRLVFLWDPPTFSTDVYRYIW
ncbi:MAG: hypothetical protein KGR26_16230, partial [Cyanobacteria bacterium REEB65]|nr:hypothetical protein [Cyanobacteria bacterium REEB65]